jgi:hypothetical protein
VGRTKPSARGFLGALDETLRAGRKKAKALMANRRPLLIEIGFTVRNNQNG